jgi:hypothetical protein
MTCSLRLTIFVTFVLAAAGCGSSGMQTVGKARWQKVPAAQRGPIDEHHSAALVQANAERAAAAKAVAEARRAIAESTPHADPSLKQAAAEVDRTKAAWLRANLAWQQSRLDLADRHLLVVRCERELARAEAVYEHTPGDEEFDVTGFRGQLAQAQEDWYAAKPRPAEARAEVDRRHSELAAAKAEYARINAIVPEPPIVVTEGEPPPVPPPAPAPAPAPKPKSKSKSKSKSNP